MDKKTICRQPTRAILLNAFINRYDRKKMAERPTKNNVTLNSTSIRYNVQNILLAV